MSTSQAPSDASKDKYFAKLASLSAEMIEEHGKDFAMGALVLAAQWIARGESGGPPTPPVEH